MDKKETTILNAIHDFKQEMNKHFDQVGTKLDKLKKRFNEHEELLKEILRNPRH